MTRSVRARWTNAAMLVALAVAMAWLGDADDWAWSRLVPGLYLAGAVYASPILDRRTRTHDQVLALPPGQRRVVVYARPGCTYCLRLRWVLLGRSAPVWVDVWDDPGASAFVREVNGGDETVPTVVLEGRPVTNPPPSRVLAAVRRVPTG